MNNHGTCESLSSAIYMYSMQKGLPQRKVYIMSKDPGSYCLVQTKTFELRSINIIGFSLCFFCLYSSCTVQLCMISNLAQYCLHVKSLCSIYIVDYVCMNSPQLPIAEIAFSNDCFIIMHVLYWVVIALLKLLIIQNHFQLATVCIYHV